MSVVKTDLVFFRPGTDSAGEFVRLADFAFRTQRVVDTGFLAFALLQGHLEFLCLPLLALDEVSLVEGDQNFVWRPHLLRPVNQAGQEHKGFRILLLLHAPFDVFAHVLVQTLVLVRLLPARDLGPSFLLPLALDFTVMAVR